MADPFNKIETVLACVVCGFKQGGTTFFSQMLSAHEAIDGRFEIGILCGNSPAEIRNLKPNVLQNIRRFWRVGDDVIDRMVEQKYFEEAYGVLIENSDLNPEQIKIYDKFPDYIWHLDRLSERVKVPVFAVARDPRAVFWSRQKRHLKRAGRDISGYRASVKDVDINIERFCQEYTRGSARIIEAEKRYENVSVFRLEDVVQRFEESRRRVFDKLKLDMPEANFGEYNVSSEKVRRGIDVSVLRDYERGLGEDVQEKIIMETRSAERFHALP